MQPEIPETMRAIVIASPQRAEPRFVPTPRPGAGELLIQVEGCGLCGSNVPVWEGRPWFSYPLSPGAPGHEGWGRVVAVGTGVSRAAVGRRVAFLSQHALAEYDVARADEAIELPEALDAAAIPGEAFGCAMNAFRRSGIERGHRVAVVGVGFLGAALTRLAATAGAHVVAISRREFALDLALELGAEETYVIGDEDPPVAPCDVVIEAAGVQRTLSLASKLVGVRGRLVIVGFHQDGPRQVDVQQWNWNGIDVINAHERDGQIYVAGMRAAVDAVAGGVLDPQRLVTHRFSFDRAGEAFSALVTRPPGFLKAVVTP